MFKILDSTFKREASEQAVHRLTQFNTFSRPQNEDIKAFRIRFSKLMEDVRAVGLTVSPAMEYTRAMSALSLSEHQRLSVLASISQLEDPLCPVKLREISIRLLHRPITNDIMLQQSYEESSCQGEAENEQIFTTKGGTKGRNRPGM